MFNLEWLILMDGAEFLTIAPGLKLNEDQVSL